MPKKLTELDEITIVNNDNYVYVVTSGSIIASKKAKISNLPFGTSSSEEAAGATKIWVYLNFF